MKKIYTLCLLTFASILMASNAPAPPQPPPKDPDLFLHDKAIFSTHVEFLYWKPLEGALMYALNMDRPSWNPVNTSPVGHYEHGSYDFDPGVRVTLGYFRAPRYWEIFGSYTRLTSSGSDKIYAPTKPNQYLASIWPTHFHGSLSEAKSSLHLNYNVADLQADRYFIPNPHLRVRLIAGFTAAWMDQNWTVKYQDATNHKSLVRNRWKFGGAGFRAGMMADWFWTDDVYITLRGTLAALVGAYKNTMYQTSSIQLGPDYNPSLPFRDAVYRDSRSTVNLQLLLGPSWQKSWKHARTELFAGYEITSWGNLQEIFFSVHGTPSYGGQQTTINSGILTLQGLTIRFSIDL